MVLYQDKLQKENSGFFMARFATFAGFFLIALLTAAAAPAWSAGEGYTGLFAPAQPDTPSKKEAPSGPVSTVSPALTPPAAPAAPFTQRPGYSRETIKDLPTASAVYGTGLKNKVAAKKPPKIDYSKVPQLILGGKTAMEHTVTKNIQRAMRDVSEKDLSGEERKKRAQKSYTSLGKLREGIVSQKNIPDTAYRKVGFSERYIQQEKSGIENSLQLLNQALAKLKTYQ